WRGGRGGLVSAQGGRPQAVEAGQLVGGLVGGEPAPGHPGEDVPLGCLHPAGVVVMLDVVLVLGVLRGLHCHVVKPRLTDCQETLVTCRSSWRKAAQSRSMRVPVPSPPPQHMVTRAVVASVRSSSCAAVV